MPQRTKNELKTCDRLEAGTLTIDWEKRTFTIEGCSGYCDDNMRPYLVREHLMRHGDKDDATRRAVTKVAIVVFDTSDDLLQLATYDLEEFEKEVYGPVDEETAT